MAILELVSSPLLDGVFWFWKLGYDPFFELMTLAFAFGKTIFNYRLLAPFVSRMISRM